MYENEEGKLKELYEHIQVPVDLLDEAIYAGFQTASLEKKRRWRLRNLLISLAAASIIIVFFSSIRLSPVFANYIAAIPGMEKVVDIIRTDKGKMSAIENDYYEKIGVSQEKNGLKFTIDGAIADENGLVLFYTLHSKEKHKEIHTEDVQISSLDSVNLDIGTISMGSPFYSDTGKTSYNDLIEFYFQRPLNARKFELKLKVTGQELNEIFTLQFELHKPIQQKKTYKLNKIITIEGQKIKFLTADVYPLRVAVHVKMDENNSKHIFNFEDLRLIDETGETWSKINNGVTASQLSPDEAIVYLQSNYFHDPKELYLKVNKMQAVDKDEVNVVIDPKKQSILKQPKGNYLSNLRVEGDEVSFELQTEKEFNSFMFSEIRDGDGKKIISPRDSMTGWDGGKTELDVTIPDLTKLTSPISLELTSFPTWIRGDGKVKIK